MVTKTLFTQHFSDVDSEHAKLSVAFGNEGDHFSMLSVQEVVDTSDPLIAQNSRSD